ncbi:hypothetical protein SOASR031_30490 [Leminorella grimontii]|nr:hypothetical protein SOASR031_30490 [Leminorella grimontii]
MRGYSIHCVVCKLGTHEMVDHFCLISDNVLSYAEWMWINSYMAYSDDNLDKQIFDKDDAPGRAIRWLPELDEKSKVGSMEEYQAVATRYSH